MTTVLHKFEVYFASNQDDIDHNGHVNNVSYLKWTQQASMAFWEAIVPATHYPPILWVILRHEVDYKAPSFLGESIVAQSWWGAASRVRFERHTEFFRTSDRKLLAKVRSLFCPMDSLTQRPIVLPEELRSALGLQHSTLTS